MRSILTARLMQDFFPQPFCGWSLSTLHLCYSIILQVYSQDLFTLNHQGKFLFHVLVVFILSLRGSHFRMGFLSSFDRQKNSSNFSIIKDIASFTFVLINPLSTTYEALSICRGVCLHLESRCLSER